MQERKGTFAEFLQEDREEERQLSLLKRQRQRALFIGLLDECKETGIVQLNSLSKFYQVSKKVASRDTKRFMAVDERDREDIFQDYIDDLFQKERDLRAQKSEESIELLKTIFEQHEDPVLDATSRWADINEIFKDN